MHQTCIVFRSVCLGALYLADEKEDVCMLVDVNNEENCSFKVHTIIRVI